MFWEYIVPVKWLLFDALDVLLVFGLLFIFYLWYKAQKYIFVSFHGDG